MKKRKMYITLAVLAVVFFVGVIVMLLHKNEPKKDENTLDSLIEEEKKEDIEETEKNNLIENTDEEVKEDSEAKELEQTIDKFNSQGESEEQSSVSSSDEDVEYDEIISGGDMDHKDNEDVEAPSDSTLDSNILQDDPNNKWSLPK